MGTDLTDARPTRPGDAIDLALDSPRARVAEHTRRYLRSTGVQGHVWNGMPTLVLATTGRRTGQLWRNALIYGRDGDRYVVVGSRGDHDHHPLWYLNLVEDPRASAKVGARRFEVAARTADTIERRRLWTMMEAVFPTYGDYQARTAREIPVETLTGTPHGTAPR